MASRGVLGEMGEGPVSILESDVDVPTRGVCGGLGSASSDLGKHAFVTCVGVASQRKEGSSDYCEHSRSGVLDRVCQELAPCRPSDPGMEV